MRISDIAALLQGADLTALQLRSLIKCAAAAAGASTDPLVRGFRLALDDVIEDIDHELWEEAESAVAAATLEERDDRAELAGEW
jgi:hypothetical protein